MADEEKSEIALALEERAKNRPTFLVDGLSFLGPGDKPVGAVAMRVLTKQEENVALARAEAYVRDLAKSGGVELKDPSILESASTVYALAEACRNPKHPGGMPAFSTGKWMMEHMTRDEIACLLNHYNRYAAAQSPLETNLSVDAVESEAARVASLAETDLADAVVQTKDRVWLEQAFVRLSMLWADARGQLALYHAMSGGADGG